MNIQDLNNELELLSKALVHNPLDPSIREEIDAIITLIKREENKSNIKTATATPVMKLGGDTRATLRMEERTNQEPLAETTLKGSEFGYKSIIRSAINYLSDKFPSGSYITENLSQQEIDDSRGISITSNGAVDLSEDLWTEFVTIANSERAKTVVMSRESTFNDLNLYLDLYFTSSNTDRFVIAPFSYIHLFTRTPIRSFYTLSYLEYLNSKCSNMYGPINVIFTNKLENEIYVMPKNEGGLTLYTEKTFADFVDPSFDTVNANLYEALTDEEYFYKNSFLKIKFE